MKIKRVAYETMQFFEVDLPEGHTPESFMDTVEFRQACADQVLSGFIEFTVERRFDADRNEV